MTLRGEEITNLRADKLVKLGVGFVPQTNNVFPSLTIEENLQMGGYQEPDKVRRAVRQGGRASSRRWPTAPQAARRDRSPAASARWWPWAARS